MPLSDLSANPVSLLCDLPWNEWGFFSPLFLWNGVCVDPLHGEVADGSMGSRKSAPVLVSSAPQSSDNWIIILPVCPLFSALMSLSLRLFFLLKVRAVYGFNFCQILPGPSDGTVRCLWSKRVLCSVLHGSGQACVFHLLLSVAWLKSLPTLFLHPNTCLSTAHWDQGGHFLLPFTLNIESQLLLTDTHI